jgi:hypothetical protein
MIIQCEASSTAGTDISIAGIFDRGPLMIPIVVLLASFAVLRLAGFLGVAALDNWNLSLRIALFLMFLLTASAHWGRGRPDLIRMVPAAFPAPATIITITGVLEIHLPCNFAGRDVSRQHAGRSRTPYHPGPSRARTRRARRDTTDIYRRPDSGWRIQSGTDSLTVAAR